MVFTLFASFSLPLPIFFFPLSRQLSILFFPYSFTIVSYSHLSQARPSLAGQLTVLRAASARRPANHSDESFCLGAFDPPSEACAFMALDPLFDHTAVGSSRGSFRRKILGFLSRAAGVRFTRREANHIVSYMVHFRSQMLICLSPGRWRWGRPERRGSDENVR